MRISSRGLGPGFVRGILTLALVWGVASCQSRPSGPEESRPVPTGATTSSPSSGGSPLADMMGGMALGGSARTELLSGVRVEALPSGHLAWVAYQSKAAQDAPPVTHRHAPGFVYAADGTHTVALGEKQIALRVGKAVFVSDGAEHTHAGLGRLWEILLTAPNAQPPAGLQNTGRVFASPRLEGVPAPPAQLNYILVELLPGGETSVHTHPGPEFIYVTKGPIVYQSNLTGTIRMRAGEEHALPPNTAVQKRNPGKTPVAFLSWFVVDPSKAFAPRATFQAQAAESRRPAGRNVASAKAGAKVVGVSSNYGGEGNDSAYGANHAIDGDPTKEWSSNGDGDKAWIEIELARPYLITAIGFWTRTMGASAQIQQFEVVADSGKRLGPFALKDAANTHYFPVDVTAKRLRFNVKKSSGGNTGAVEIEVLVAP